MKIVQFQHPSDGTPRIGILAEGGVLDFSAAHQACRRGVDGVDEPPITSTMELLASGRFTVETFAQAAGFAREQGLAQGMTVAEPRLLAPVGRPGKIIALGLNYASHAREGGKEPPDHPIIFQKASSAVIGPGEAIVVKPWFTRVDPEIELAVVMGRAASEVPAAQAGACVAGYTIVNDVTERDMQAADIGAAQPWFRSKSIDTFCPMGPCITLPDEIADPGALEMELRVNGEARQKANTRDLVFGVAELIAFISKHMAFEPGDVISTGTPAGIAPIVPGDVVECEVDGIGILRNPVRAQE
jgi:2-keto-4-pentenoate hydratase/2-oxohepta-3-ene-1,7-dioic acid hydratase in catechol pathway